MSKSNTFGPVDPAVARVILAKFWINESVDRLASNEDLYFVLTKIAYYYFDYVKKTRTYKSDIKYMEPLLLSLSEIYPPIGQIIPRLPKINQVGKYLQTKTVTCGLICYDKKIEKVLTVSHTIAPNVYSFPKGKVMEGETYIQAAVRETLEETGIDASMYADESNYFTYERAGRAPAIMFHVFGLDASSKIVPPTPLEVSKIQWIPISHLQKYNNITPDPPTKKYVIPSILSLVKQMKSSEKQSKDTL